VSARRGTRGSFPRAFRSGGSGAYRGVMTVNAVAGLPLLTHQTDGWGHHPWWPLWLLFWAALIGTTVWLIVRRRNRRADPFDRARQLLAERFARGELNGEEYRARLDELERHSQGGKQGG
jgi:putative membrane protein